MEDTIKALAGLLEKHSVQLSKGMAHGYFAKADDMVAGYGATPLDAIESLARELDRLAEDSEPVDADPFAEDIARINEAVRPEGARF